MENEKWKGKRIPENLYIISLIYIRNKNDFQGNNDLVRYLNCQITRVQDSLRQIRNPQSEIRVTKDIYEDY